MFFLFKGQEKQKQKEIVSVNFLFQFTIVNA